MSFDGWNYGDLLDAVAREVEADRPALISGRSVTSWGDFDRRTNNLAAGLIAAGSAPGEKVAFYLRNHPAYLEGTIASFKARLVHVNVNYRYLEPEVQFILENSDATIVIFGREFGPIVEQLKIHLPQVRNWLFVDDGSGEPVPAFATAYEKLARGGDGQPLGNARSPDDLLLLYTGGTTGMPKGVMWRQDSLRRALLSPVLVETVPQNLDEHLALIRGAAGPVALPACPLMHGTGLFASLSALVAGGTVVTLESGNFDPHELWAAVERDRVQQIVIVGDAFAKPMLRVLAESGRQFDLSSIAAIISSGVMWSMETKQGLLHYMPEAKLLDSFGSSEAMGFGLSITTRDGEIATAKFTTGDNVKVFTPDGVEIAPGTGQAGLIARGDPISEGYYKDDAKTAETFKIFGGQRYCIPGDFCTVEADGSLTLLGRGNGCINTAGEKVFPEEVEEMLKLHPDVEDSLVFGFPHEKWGQAVAGIVELRPGAFFDEAALLQHARAHLAGYKIPKALAAVDQMFRASNGKPDYQRARELLIKLQSSN